VQASHSYTAEEALNQHLIDVIANNDADLLNSLEGREITRMDGSKVTLHLAGARIDVVRPTLREELLGWLVNPNIALLFLVGGALLIYLEFNSPGTIVPGALGTLMVLLAIFALNLLPIRYTAVMLMLAAMVLLLLEAKFGAHGALAIAGIVCLTFGTLTLVLRRCRRWDQPAGGPKRERGVWRDYRVPGAAGGTRAVTEGAHWRGSDGWMPGHGDGSAWLRRAMWWWRARSGGPWRARRFRREPRCAWWARRVAAAGRTGDDIARERARGITTLEYNPC